MYRLHRSPSDAAKRKAYSGRHSKRRPRRAHTSGLLTVVGALAVGFGTVLAPSAAHASLPLALINGDTVSGGMSSPEAGFATAAGFSVEVVDGATWRSMTAADFARYQLLIAGDPDCGVIADSLVASQPTWGPVVMGQSVTTQPGNRVLVGTDPVLHSGGVGDRSKVIAAGIAFAGAQPGRTGLYFDSTCGGNYYGQTGLAASMMQQLSTGVGTWTENDQPPCGGNVAKIASTPLFDPVTTADLEGWSCSVHESFPTFASDWSPLAVATDTDTKPVCGTDTTVDPPATACGEPYILIAGSDIVVVSPDISVSPADATNPVGTSHTVTAHVAKAGTPIVGQKVDFTITGVNAGVAGTCAPAGCLTDGNGDVTFTYTDVNGAGDDTITASFTRDGTTQQATAAKHWVGTGPVTPTITTTPSPSVPAGGAVSDTATLTDGNSPTGSVSFGLYGPNDSSCTGTPVAIRKGTVSGGSASSGDVTVDKPGTYLWVATYSGDANNTSVTSPCGSETVVVTKATPTISTTPSGSVPAGGNVSDTAVLSGGAAPSGTVTFTLYGADDPTCAGTPLATRTGTVSGGTAKSGDVPVGPAGTYNWVATYSGDDNNNSVTSPCGDEPVVVTPQTLTGRAYGLSAKVTGSLGSILVNLKPTPDTGAISTTESSSTPSNCKTGQNQGPYIYAKTLCSNVTTVAYPGKSTATASVEETNLNVGSIPTVVVRGVKAASQTTCGGSVGAVTIDYLAVGTTVVISAPKTIAPNTKVTVGSVSLVLNEQTAFTSPDAGLTVNAVHLRASTLLAKADVVIASAESDIANCP